MFRATGPTIHLRKRRCAHSRAPEINTEAQRKADSGKQDCSTSVEQLLILNRISSGFTCSSRWHQPLCVRSGGDGIPLGSSCFFAHCQQSLITNTAATPLKNHAHQVSSDTSERGLKCRSAKSKYLSKKTAQTINQTQPDNSSIAQMWNFTGITSRVRCGVSTWSLRSQLLPRNKTPRRRPASTSSQMPKVNRGRQYRLWMRNSPADAELSR